MLCKKLVVHPVDILHAATLRLQLQEALQKQICVLLIPLKTGRNILKPSGKLI